MGEYTFSKDERIKKKKEFIKFFSEGKKIYGQYLNIYLLKSVVLKKLGITFNSKIKKSVVRNRIKRILKEIFRKNKKNLFEGYDILFIVKPEIYNLNYYQIEDEIRKMEEIFQSSKKISL